jgi:para-aminobenzoate synthetase / 4-amino-4-deoxychorismate lyase
MAYLPTSGIRHLDLHLRRMTRSAAYFGYAFNEASVIERLDPVTRSGEPATVRLGLGRRGDVRLDLRPPPRQQLGPILLAMDADPIDFTQPWPFHKTSRREPYTVRRQRHVHADDVVL